MPQWRCRQFVTKGAYSARIEDDDGSNPFVSTTEIDDRRVP